VEVLDGETAGLVLLPYIANRHCLLIVDAVRGGKPPGVVRTGLGLSDEVRAGMDGLLEAIAERLRLILRMDP